ncbi:FAD-binding and (Fe-S)-binding domain-containing protein [Streptomyces sp. gCLA4]|uniref:FAD-binding and (Fe-S)-binding domain-containing protein n=1 Tax=Streptomyces sp. gCLA4 TaxID=1873416 RepID=UPI0016049D05|nr:FAD-binding and (Fe-S)-binding domain-containing protein [Streptomyces sp. gCLA4]
MRDLERTLRAELRGEVDFGAAARALVAMDASNYRRVPVGVVAPRDADDVAAALHVCAEAGVPVVPRGGGTSIAGQATGTGVVLDLTRHMNGLLSVDPAARTAVVQPGLVLGRLRDAVRPYGLTFGPDPSTHSRCTLGGMIGNNACGAHSVAWGTTADNVTELAVTTYAGTAHRIGTGWAGAPDGLRELVGAHLGLLRTGMPPRFSRRISGYGGLDALLPERGVRLAQAFCGSEGTLGVVTEAVVRLVELPPAPALAVLGYADESAAADAAAGLLPYRPLTVEGMAEDLVGAAGGVAALPRGRAWLFVEMPDEGAARAVVRGADALDALVVTDPAGQRALWRIREDAAGTATRMPDGRMAWPGWEDCAVPPARLGAYLREFRALLAAHGLRGTPYGHFGEGCVHVRIDFDLASAAGVARFRTFSEELAGLVVAHGGSLSGEHGDGQARAELLPKMYGADVVRLFAAYKDVWDPAGGMNPGMLVRPARLDENLRFAVLPATPFAGEVARCVGVAKCRTAAPPDGTGVMCPSYRVTGEEQHSTRGRARLLHEMLAGEVVTGGWRSPEVAEALDLCLACKGCLSDCPVGVDMASYKSEFLYHHWAGRIRPLAHYTLGGLPAWLRLIARLRAAGAVNAAARLLPVPVPGLARERALPELAKRPFTRDASAVTGRAAGRRPRGGGDGPPGAAGGPSGAAREAAAAVTLWPDTFTEYLAPEVGHAALRVLRAAGLDVSLPRGGGPVCCGLTYLSTGRLDRARKVLRRTLDTLGEVPGPVTVLEPSCAAALRADLPALLPDDPRAARLAAAVRTVAETLEEYAPDWLPPRLDRPVVGQTHCHQHAVLGDAADRRLRERAGLVGEPVGGCCGLAGNFGFEPGHHEVSVACAEEQLLPSLRAARAGALVQADGFSCRTQIAQLGGVRARHLVELLAEGLADGPAGRAAQGAPDTQP